MRILVALLAAILLLGTSAAPAIAQADSAEITFWESVRDSTDVAELEAYLKAYPEGQFAPLARLRLKKLSAGSAKDQDKAAAPGAGKTAASEPPVHECDRLAANPSDPDRKAEGVRLMSMDADKARRACEAALAAFPGVRRFAYQLGRALHKSGSYAEAVRRYREAASKGSVSAMTNLGVIYAEGRGVTKDEAEAVRWYRKAAEKGFARAMNSLGIMYGTGRGVAEDQTEAIWWFRKAAEKGAADAMSNLGFRYARGWGVAQDDGQAFQWLRRSADKGYPLAIYGVGYMYEFGRGVERNALKAADLVFRAVKAGDGFAKKQMLENAHEWSPTFRRELQRLMRQEGVYTGPVDGSFGPATKRAIETLAQKGKTPARPAAAVGSGRAKPDDATTSSDLGLGTLE